MDKSFFLYISLKALHTAYSKFPTLFLFPKDFIIISSIPANWNNFLASFGTGNPVPLGTDINCTFIDPLFPSTLLAIVYTSSSGFLKNPLFIGIIFNLSSLPASLIVLYIFLEAFIPKPTIPFKFSIITIALNLFPIFLILIHSSFNL